VSTPPVRRWLRRPCPPGLLLAALSWGAAAAASELPQAPCTPGQELSRLEGVHSRTNALIYHKGYLVQNEWDTGVNYVWDLSDPAAPRLVKTYRERWSGHHTFTFIGETVYLDWAGYNDLDLSALPELSIRYSLFTPEEHAVGVIDSSLADSEEVSYYPLGFESVSNSYGYKQIGVFTIHDMRQPGRPQIGEVNILSDTGFEGRPNVIGNLMLVRGDNEGPQGLAAYDISDPSAPLLLDSLRTLPDGRPLIKAYNNVPIWGHFAILGMSRDTVPQRGIDIVDFSDPTNLRHVARIDVPGRPRYAQFQDEYMFIGDAKVDMRTLEIVETFPDGGGEYNLPIGNLLATAGMDRADTGRVFCHQAEPDTRPPMVTFHSPADGEIGVAVTGRVGLVIPETLDLRTVNAETVQLRVVGGGAVEADRVLSDHDVLNLTPRSPLAEDTTYELVLPAGGLSDVAGNTLTEDFRFTFSTGSALGRGAPPVLEALTLSDAVVGAGEPVEVAARASDPDGRGLRYQIAWGDGGEEPLQRGRALRHVYPEPGLYSARLQVRDRDGNVVSRAFNVAAQPAAGGGRPASSTAAIDPRRRQLWVVNPDNDTATAIALETGRALREVAVPADPRSVAVSAAGEVWIASRDEPAVTVLDGESGRRLASIPLPAGSRPEGLVLSPDGRFAYVALMGTGRLLKLDAGRREVLAGLEVGPWPGALALTGDGGTLLAARFISGDERGEVYRVPTDTFDRSEVIPLPQDTWSQDSDGAGRGLPSYLLSVAVAPDDRTVWVGAKKDNVLRGEARDGRALRFENTLRSIVCVLDLEAGRERVEDRLDVDNHELVSAVAFSGDGLIAYVAHQGNNTVTAFDARSHQVLDRVEVGRAPRGLAVDPVSGRVYVHNFLSRSVSALDLFTGPGGGPAAFALRSEVGTVAHEALPPEVLAGKRLFYDASDRRISRDGYLSCAACHLDGGHDGRVWDFTDRGEGLRNTISLQGRRGDGHGPVHWSANFDEIQDFEHDMRGPFEGHGLLAAGDFAGAGHPLGAPKAGLSGDLDALAAYLRSLEGFGASPHRGGDGSLTAAGASGRAVFERSGCAGCHGGADFTDSALGVRHDVGTLKPTSGGRLGGALVGLDTPTLRGLWLTAPYLHDGSAETLHDALSIEGHGARLSDTERDDLVAFLLQIDDDEPGAPPVAAWPVLTSLEDGAVPGEPPITLAVGGLPAAGPVGYYANDRRIEVTPGPSGALWVPEISGDYRVFARVEREGGGATLTPERSLRVALPAEAPARPGFTLAWQDDFDTLDWKHRWLRAAHTFEDNAAQFSSEQTRAGGGVLHLGIAPTGYRTEGDRRLLAGELRTFETFQYGRFEVRAKLPAAEGVISSLFTFYDFFSDPSLEQDWNQLEVQFMGRDTTAARLHTIYWDERGEYTDAMVEHPLGFDASAGFHVYAVEWTPGRVRFFVDDVLVHTQTGEPAEAITREAKLVLNTWPVKDLERLQSWAGRYDPGGPPVELQIDWVRVYRYTPE
jgi:YVTN family beta-propeller protein